MNRSGKMSMLCLALVLAAACLAPCSPAMAYDYKFMPLDVLGAKATYAYGLNDQGQVVGIWLDSEDLAHGFLYDKGAYRPLEVLGARGTWAFGINNAGDIVGAYMDSASVHGFRYDGQTYHLLDIPGVPAGNFQGAYGINNAGLIAGSYRTDSFHSFLYDKGAYTPLDVLGASDTQASGLDDLGRVVGYYGSDAGIRGFHYDGQGYQPLDVLGAFYTRAWGTNNAGLVVGTCDRGSGAAGFIYDGLGYQPLQVLGASETYVRDINNLNWTVGYYQDASGIHGFLAVPLPSPLLLVGTGLAALAFWRRRYFGGSWLPRSSFRKHRCPPR
jgi:hypothetical protein